MSKHNESPEATKPAFKRFRTGVPATDENGAVVFPPRMNETLAAIYLDTTPANLRRSRCVGTLLGKPAPEFLKIGKRVVYEKETLEAWLKLHAKPCRNTGEARQLVRG